MASKLVVLLLLTTTTIISPQPSISSPSPPPPPPPVRGFKAPLIHRDSVHSPFYNPMATAADLHKSALMRDRSRLEHLNSVMAADHGPNTASHIPIDFNGVYFIRYKIGTPAIDTYGIFDTGSTLVWLQCKQCTTCFNQGEYPLYDPQNSETWYQVTCPESACVDTDMGNYCDKDPPNYDSPCLYDMEYEDNSYSKGRIGTETIWLGNDNFTNLVFGCGLNSNFTVAAEVKPPGIVGFSRGAFSLVYQLGSGRFSYCISDNTSEPSSVKFGSSAVIQEGTNKRTTMYGEHNLYYIGLEDISVDDRRLNIDYSSFTEKTPDGLGSIVVDSGTTYTYLPVGAYAKLDAAVRKFMSDRGYDSSDTGERSFQLCYGLFDDPNPDEWPEIIFHFKGGLQLILSNANAWFEGCLAFEQHRFGYAALGMHQHRSVEIGLDLTNNVLTFMEAAYCG